MNQRIVDGLQGKFKPITQAPITISLSMLPQKQSQSGVKLREFLKELFGQGLIMDGVKKMLYSFQ